MNIISCLNKIRNDKGVILAAAWSFNQLAYAIVYPFIPIYLSQERQIPYTTVSLIFPLMGLAVMIAPVPCGWMTDKLGRTFTMLFGQLGRAVMFFLLAFMVFVNAPFWLFAVSLMLNSGVGAAFQVGADAYLTDITTPEERPGYFGKIRIGYNVGWAIGPMLGAFFAKTPFWLFFLLTGLLCVVGAVYTKYVCFKNYQEPYVKNTQKKHGDDDFNFLTAVFNNRNFLFLLAGTLFLMLLTSQLYSTLSAFSTQRIGISKEALGTIYSLNGLTVLLLQLPIVALMKKLKIPEHYQLISGTLLYSASFCCISFIGTAVLLGITVVVITLAEIIVQPALYTLISCETKGEYAGRMLSLYSLMRGIGYSVGPWIGAHIFESTKSSFVLWGTLSSFAAVSAVIFLLSKKKTVSIYNLRGTK